jgi:lysophospholipase L1-like esterase
MSDGKQQNVSPWGQKLVLLAIGLSLGLIFSEAVLRLAGISYPQPYAPDPHCGTRLRPGFEGWWRKEGRAYIRINRYGFRHGDRGPAKPAETWRVAVLGDSFIEAFQVPEEQTFCAQLERRLQACADLAGRRVEVLNFGVSGYGTAQQLRMLRHYAAQYRPDLVLLAFFPGNDLRNNSAELEPYQVRPFYHLQGDDLVLDESFRQHPDYVKAQSAWVRGKFALTDRMRTLQLVYQLRDAWRQPAVTDGRFGVDLAALAEPRNEAWRQAWELTERLLAETAAEATRHQARFLVLTVGSDVQVHPDPSVRAAAGRQLGAHDLAYADRRLDQWGRQHGIDVINLAEPMGRHASENRAYLHGFDNTQLGTGHWNPEGHRVAAEIAAAAICGTAAVTRLPPPPPRLGSVPERP